jgi:DNA-binding NarL/FixJ family response regulator
MVDDHGMVRRGMRSYLEMVPDVEVVGEASEGQAALDGIAQLVSQGEEPPDVVIMDLLMPGMDGVSATTALKATHPAVEVVALTSFVTQDRVDAALQAGALGYILKDAEVDELSAAIRAAWRGDVYLSPAAAEQLARSLPDLPPDAAGATLTDRERQVLALVAAGASNKAIAALLSISERTARTHVSNILTKLGLGSRTQAALWAIREGRDTS